MERVIIEESYEKVLMIEIYKIWNPDPLVWTECIEIMIRCAQSGAWVPVSKYFINLNQLSTLPHLPSFQNGLSQHVTIITSHFFDENVRIVKCGPLVECVMSFVQSIHSNQGTWFPCFEYFSRSNLLLQFPYLSSF